MSRINTPTTISEAPEASQAGLQAVEAQLGSVPNLLRIVSNSPSGLEGYLGLNGALGKGKLTPTTRERIALAVAEVNGCDYCLAAHTYLAKNVAGLNTAKITANRKGHSGDVKADAAVRFAVEIVNARGKVEADSIKSVLSAGYSEAEIVEIIAHVALNTFTNYINSALETEIDYPQIDEIAA